MDLLRPIATSTAEATVELEEGYPEPEELQAAQRALLKRMVESHRLSAERMIATLTCKIEVLKRLMP